jgi:hypothetical protein
VFENLLAPWRAKYHTALASVACYAIAGVAAAIAAAFLLAALYSWLAGIYGTIAACLIIAGGFLALSIIPIAILAGVKRREERRVAAAAARARSTQWFSPATLSLGLQAARMVGKNRGIAAAAIGTILLGLLASRMVPTDEEKRAEEPAE